jgi:tetratricopeptide (TPR) repeat protein
LDARGAAGFSTLQRLAVAYEQLQRPAEARKTLERVAQLDPQNPAHLLELARLAEDAKDHEGALGYLAHARDLAPDMARIHFLFGLIAGEMNLPIEARQSLDKALAIEPDNPDYNYAMGSAILQTRDAATAASYFQKFVKAKPADAKGHFALGVAEFTAGDYANAKQEMRIAGNSPMIAPAAQYYLGRIARLEGDLDQAQSRLNQAVTLMPKFSEAHTELARIAMLKGNLPEAHLQLDRALQLKPESFQANEQLLILYKRTGDARATAQAQALKKLDEERSKRADLMLRTIEMRP